MLASQNYPITIAETATYIRSVSKLLQEDEQEKLIDYIAYNPGEGDVIPGTRGVRIMRWPMGNRGKRRELWAVYYFRDLNMALYLLTAYSKGRKSTLSDDERSEMRALVDELVDCHCRKTWAMLEASEGHT